jgi:hypothetical protein
MNSPLENLYIQPKGGGYNISILGLSKAWFLRQSLSFKFFFSFNEHMFGKNFILKPIDKKFLNFYY